MKLDEQEKLKREKLKNIGLILRDLIISLLLGFMAIITFFAILTVMFWYAYNTQ